MTTPLTPEALAFGLTTASDPQLSPNGTRVAYTLSVVDEQRQGRRQVWLCAVGGGHARPAIPALKDTTGARWSTDGAQLALAMESESGWSIAVVDPDDSSTLREVSQHAQEVAELAWAPDGRHIVYTTHFDPDNPDERPDPPGAAPKVRVTRRLDYKEDGRGYLGDRRKQVFVVEVATASTRRLTSDPLDHDSPQWLPDSRHVGMRVHLRDRAGDHLLIVDLESEHEEWFGHGRGPIVHWSVSPDGDRVAFAADPDQTLQPDYFVYSRSNGVTRRMTSNLRSFPDLASPAWLDDQRVLFHSFIAGASALEILDSETGEIEALERPHSRHAGLSIDGRSRYIVQAESSLESIGEIRVFDRNTNSPKTITGHNAWLLEQHPPAAYETLSVPRGEFAIDAWLLKPPGFDPRRRYPVILDVHGGPNANYGYGFLAHEQCLATNGFLVVYANPRGSTSYGRQFARQVIREWGRGDYQDLMAVLDYVLERPEADRGRTGIFGFSYGGYLTAWAISQSNRFKAAVCGEPIFDLESDYGTSDVAFNGLEHHGGGPPHAERGWYAGHSPSTFAHQTRTPTLIVHGEADDRCPIGQSEQMFVALRKAGCETEFVRYPGGSHMFFAQGLPAHRADFLTRTLRWFKQHLGEPQ
jgi:acylaminoacyl-peptidase